MRSLARALGFLPTAHGEGQRSVSGFVCPLRQPALARPDRGVEKDSPGDHEEATRYNERREPCTTGSPTGAITGTGITGGGAEARSLARTERRNGENSPRSHGGNVMVGRGLSSLGEGPSSRLPFRKKLGQQ